MKKNCYLLPFFLFVFFSRSKRRGSFRLYSAQLSANTAEQRRQRKPLCQLQIQFSFLSGKRQESRGRTVLLSVLQCPFSLHLCGAQSGPPSASSPLLFSSSSPPLMRRRAPPPAAGLKGQSPIYPRHITIGRTSTWWGSQAVGAGVMAM